MTKQPLSHSLLLLVTLLLTASNQPAHADALLEQLNQLAAQQVTTVPLTAWKFHQPAIQGGEALDVDDSHWQPVAPGFEWQGESSQVWFRTRYVVPATVGGTATEGDAVRLEVGLRVARAGIPYGSIERPTSGQEYPGQKWMDVTAGESHPVSEGVPLPLDTLFNSDSTGNFDTEKRGYDASLLPAPGLYPLGASRVPFHLPGHTGADNIACGGQSISLPANSGGKTLYLLGSSIFGDQGGLMTVVGTTGRLSRLPVRLNDWALGGSVENEVACYGVLRLKLAHLPQSHFVFATTGEAGAVGRES